MAALNFSSGQIDQLSRLLAETTTGGELDKLLNEARLPPSEVSTKWRRLRDSFERVQRRDGGGNAIARFICLATAPERYLGDKVGHEAIVSDVNECLSFGGVELQLDGSLKKVSAVKTVGEAEQRADHLKSKLRDRNVHSDVLVCCRAELVEKNYFHAVLEAAKSVAEKIRSISGIQGDSTTLVDAAFSTKGDMPPIAFNLLDTSSLRSEHVGIATMLRGFFMTFRNPTAHAPKVGWALNENDALEMLVMASMFHRRLDEAFVTPSAPIRIS